MTCSVSWTEANAADALAAFDSTLAHPWLDLQPIDALDASLVDLPYSHLLLPSPPQSSTSPLQSEMSLAATQHARHSSGSNSSLRTPMPAKRWPTLPHSATSASSATPVMQPAARRCIGLATPSTAKQTAAAASHHRRVSSFSPSTLSPQAADDKQVGRTPRRRAVEANHRIASPQPAAQPTKEADSGPTAAAAVGAWVSSTPPSPRRPTGGDGREEQPADADAISDDDILGKLHQLLEEALVIQQAQGQTQEQHTPRTQPEPHRPLADITNTTPITRLAQRMDKARSELRSAPRTAAAAKDNSHSLATRTLPRKSALKQSSATSAQAPPTGASRAIRPATKRAILIAQPASSSSQSTAATCGPASLRVAASTTASELSAVIRRFLQRVLSLLRVIERLLSRRLAELRVEAMKAMKDSLCGTMCGTSVVSACLERLASRSSSLLHSVHAALNTPIITVHYPEALSAFIPAFLSSSVSTPPPSPAPQSAAATAASAPPLGPRSCLPSAAPVPASPLGASSPLPSPSSLSARVEPAASPSVDQQQQRHQQRGCCPTSETERAVLLSTISQLQSVLASQQAVGLPSQSSPLSALTAENRDLRTLIEAQEQQIGRQQEMIAQARRQIEWQCQPDASQSSGSSDSSDRSEMGVSLELSALSEAVYGSIDGSGGSGCGSGSGNVSALMRAEWESGVQEVLSW